MAKKLPGWLIEPFVGHDILQLLQVFALRGKLIIGVSTHDKGKDKLLSIGTVIIGHFEFGPLPRPYIVAHYLNPVVHERDPV